MYQPVIRWQGDLLLGKDLVELEVLQVLAFSNLYPAAVLALHASLELDHSSGGRRRVNQKSIVGTGKRQNRLDRHRLWRGWRRRRRRRRRRRNTLARDRLCGHGYQVRRLFGAYRSLRELVFHAWSQSLKLYVRHTSFLGLGNRHLHERHDISRIRPIEGLCLEFIAYRLCSVGTQWQRLGVPRPCDQLACAMIRQTGHLRDAHARASHRDHER